MPGGPRVGVFGGTFDPFHHGHLVAAVAVRHQLHLDTVLVMVANRPWQKEGARTITPAAHRIALAEASVDGVAGVRVSAMEVERGGPTYTVDTMDQLRRADPDAELFLVIGADVAAELGTWHRVDDLRREAMLAVVTRSGTDVPPAALAGWSVHHVEIPRLEISSTDIRRRVAEGQPIDGLVPAAAVREIAARGLYAPS